MSATAADLEQHSLWRSVALSLAPGVLTIAISLLLFPATERAGFPPLLATMIASVLGVSVFPLGLMLREAWRISGRLSLQGVIPYREPIPRRQFVLLLAPLLGWALAVLALTAPLSEAWRISLFGWMPRQFLTPIDPSQCTHTALLITGAAVLVLSPFLINPVEELYYRGYLLPRLRRLGAGAPLLNTALWACIHLHQPWGIPSLFMAMLPTVAVVHWKRNVWLIVVGHALGNFLMILAMMVRGVR